MVVNPNKSESQKKAHPFYEEKHRLRVSSDELQRIEHALHLMQASDAVDANITEMEKSQKIINKIQSIQIEEEINSISEEERERLNKEAREQYPTDASKLRLVANWFDVEQFTNGRWRGKDGDTAVQDDLRRIADRLEEIDK